MKINRRHLLLGIFSLGIILILCGYFYLNQSHRNIGEEEVRFTFSSSELEESLSTSESARKIADQVIKTEGMITAHDEKSITIDNKVEVSFTQKLPIDLKAGMGVIIKGRCVGYDDLLKRVKVDQAILVKLF